MLTLQFPSHLTGVPGSPSSRQGAERSSAALWLRPELCRKLLSLPGCTGLPSLFPLPGYPQLWPWRLRAHHPLGLCPGGSQPLWENSRRKEVAQHTATSPLKTPVITTSPRTPHLPLSQPISASPSKLSLLHFSPGSFLQEVQEARKVTRSISGCESIPLRGSLWSLGSLCPLRA